MGTIIKRFVPPFFAVVGTIILISNSWTNQVLSYHRYLPENIITLDPSASIERYSQSVILQIYDPLFRTEDGITAVPHIADSFSYDASTRTYTINLRNDVFFHDNVQLSTDDVLFTIQRLCNKPNTNVTLLPLIKGCKDHGSFGVKKSGAFQLTIQLSEDFPPFISILSSPHFMVLPAAYHGGFKNLTQ